MKPRQLDTGAIAVARALLLTAERATSAAQLGQGLAQRPRALEPLELSGKLRGILLQYHPRFVKSTEAKDELALVRGLLDPLVPLVEFRHRSWLDEGERDDTLVFLERNGLAYVSVDAPPTRASNVLPPVAAATHRVAYVRFHGRNVKTWNIRSEKASDRFDWMYSADELAEWLRTPPDLSSPPRDELVVKVLIALRVPGIDVRDLVQAHRRALVELMQQYTRLKADTSDADIGLALVVDAELFRLDAVVRWLDAVDGRLQRLPTADRMADPTAGVRSAPERIRRRMGVRR